MKKKHYFGLITGFTDRGFKISLQDCWPSYEEEELTAATFMKLLWRESGSPTSKEA
jgi:hypothetical protein